ncbi:MAG: Rpn family recombination-promoting nuclease/putative transposase [Desulfovibrio sp.]|nr:Rpn family recombination-promoting nuclease/putative transposase [Desulfovibrio sp.]
MTKSADEFTHSSPFSELKGQEENSAKKDSPPWDAINKAAFQHPEVLRDFLRLYVHEDFVNDLDLSDPEPLPSEFVTEAMRKRYNDYIRKIRWKDSDAYLLLILEFQSTIDPWIPVRILSYTALLWLDLIKKGKLTREAGLPPVFPIVLYSGEANWEGTLNIAHLLSPAARPVIKYQPTNLSLLVRENVIKNDLLNANSDLYALFLMIRRAKNTQDFRLLITKYKSVLQDPERRGLLKTFLALMNVMQTYFKTNSEEKVDFSSLEEVEEMLQSYAEQFKENTIKEREPVWKKEYEQTYKDSCEAKGILSSIYNFLDARFGSVSSSYENRLQSIKTMSELQTFNQEVYKVNSINEFEALLDKACSGNNS